MERVLWRLILAAGLAMAGTSWIALSVLAQESRLGRFYHDTWPSASMYEFCLWAGIAAAAVGGAELLFVPRVMKSRLELALPVIVIFLVLVILCGLLVSILPPGVRE